MSLGSSAITDQFIEIGAYDVKLIGKGSLLEILENIQTEMKEQKREFEKIIKELKTKIIYLENKIYDTSEGEGIGMFEDKEDFVVLNKEKTKFD